MYASILFHLFSGLKLSKYELSLTPDTNETAWFLDTLLWRRKKQPQGRGDLDSSSALPLTTYYDHGHHVNLTNHLQNEEVRLRCSRSDPPRHRLLLVTILAPHLLAVIKSQLYSYFRHEEKTKEKRYKSDGSPLGT